MALVLLHGIPTDARLWDGVRAELEPGVPVFAPDLPGARGAPPLPRPSLEAHADALVAALDARGLDRPHLVGHDYGGLVALAVAARRSVGSLTLCSTTVGLGWLPARLTALPPWRALFYRRWEGRRWLALGVSPPRVEALLQTFPGASPTYMEALARRIPLRAPSAPLGGPPVTCLWGDADRSVPHRMGRALARRLGGELALLPGLRHYAMWEDPAAWVAAWRATRAGRAALAG